MRHPSSSPLVALPLLAALLLPAPAAAAPLDPALVQAAVEQAARRNLPDTIVDVEVHSVFLRGTIDVPDGAQVSVHVRADGGEDWLGRVALQADVFVDGVAQRPAPVSAEIIGLVAVPVLRQAVSRGERVRPEDVALARREAGTLPAGTIRDLRDLVGRTPRRDLGFNQVVRTTDVEDRVDALRNRPVTLVVQSGLLRVLSPGVLRADARIGELVEVFATATGNQVYGILRTVDVVEIPFGGIPAAVLDSPALATPDPSGTPAALGAR